MVKAIIVFLRVVLEALVQIHYSYRVVNRYFIDHLVLKLASIHYSGVLRL